MVIFGPAIIRVTPPFAAYDAVVANEEDTAFKIYDAVVANDDETALSIYEAVTAFNTYEAVTARDADTAFNTYDAVVASEAVTVKRFVNGSYSSDGAFKKSPDPFGSVINKLYKVSSIGANSVTAPNNAILAVAT